MIKKAFMHIGKAEYNKPTTFEEATKVPEEEIPLPPGYKAIPDERFSSLCFNPHTDIIVTRVHRYFASQIAKSCQDLTTYLRQHFTQKDIDQCILAVRVFGDRDVYDESRLRNPVDPFVTFTKTNDPIEGYPSLYEDTGGDVYSVKEDRLMSFHRRKNVDKLRNSGIPESTIIQAARYSINKIAKSVGIEVYIRDKS